MLLTYPYKSRSRQLAFTLIEVMVVVVILSILAAFVVPKVMDRPDQARMAKARQDIKAIESALNLYRLDNYRYPSTDQGLQALVNKPSNASNWKQGGYLERVPKDPWNRDYVYLSPGTKGEVDIYSFGADGQAGGEGVDADIGNWTE
ncbi:MAG TPA: type II secretion system major pseudopilin GspG [Gammaproteobacteria bacterium]|nr:type II secretion system major pseudopilin GspG [Gammaproteobacteria bacterium]